MSNAMRSARSLPIDGGINLSLIEGQPRCQWGCLATRRLACQGPVLAKTFEKAVEKKF
jgi:hypothetical protein